MLIPMIVYVYIIHTPMISVQMRQQHNIPFGWHYSLSLTRPSASLPVIGQRAVAEECWSRVPRGRMSLRWQRAAVVRWFLLMLLWQWASLGPLSWVLALAEPNPSPFSSVSGRTSGQLDWLLSDKGPFHRCPEYTEFKERFQQGFTTRYKIYR